MTLLFRSSHIWFSYIHNFIIILSRVYNEPIQRPAPSWLVSLIGRALHWYRRGQGFESRTSLNFYSGFLFATAKVAYITAMIFIHIILRYILIAVYRRLDRSPAKTTNTASFLFFSACTHLSKGLEQSNFAIIISLWISLFYIFDGVIRRKTWYTHLIVTFAVTCTKCLARCIDFSCLCLLQIWNKAIWKVSWVKRLT